jgi:hypothetical protein
MSEEIADRVRLRVESCDSFGGFLVISSLGGGTSSGLGMRVIEEARQTYPERIMQTYKLYPDLATAHPLQIYNSTHSISKETEYSDLTMLFDNAWMERAMAR